MSCREVIHTTINLHHNKPDDTSLYLFRGSFIGGSTVVYNFKSSHLRPPVFFINILFCLSLLYKYSSNSTPSLLITHTQHDLT